MERPVHTIKDNAETLVVFIKETGLELNADKAKYMVMSAHQNDGQIHSMNTENRYFERVDEFKQSTASKSQNTNLLRMGDQIYCTSGSKKSNNVMVSLSILIFVTSTSLLIFMRTKHSAVCNNREWYGESTLGQGSWRDEVRVFLLKTDDEKM